MKFISPHYETFRQYSFIPFFDGNFWWKSLLFLVLGNAFCGTPGNWYERYVQTDRITCMSKKLIMYMKQLSAFNVLRVWEIKFLEQICVCV